MTARKPLRYTPFGKAQKEWDKAVKTMREAGKGLNYRVETATDAKALLYEGRDNMNNYPKCTSDFKKSFAFHPNEANSTRV